MSTESDSNLSWQDEYRRDLSTYETCASKLELLIEDLLDEAGIDVVAVESRAKEPDSFVRKVERKKDEYKHPLIDVTDLIGVRVIAYYLEEIDRIGALILEEFDVDPDNSADKLEDLEPDRFGYRSVHYIVSHTEKRSDLAAVEHKLSYKRKAPDSPERPIRACR